MSKRVGGSFLPPVCIISAFHLVPFGNIIKLNVRTVRTKCALSPVDPHQAKYSAEQDRQAAVLVDAGRQGWRGRKSPCVEGSKSLCGTDRVYSQVRDASNSTQGTNGVPVSEKCVNAAFDLAVTYVKNRGHAHLSLC